MCSCTSRRSGYISRMTSGSPPVAPVAWVVAATAFIKTRVSVLRQTTPRRLEVLSPRTNAGGIVLSKSPARTRHLKEQNTTPPSPIKHDPRYIIALPIVLGGCLQNKDLHCVAISTMIEGGSEPFPVLQVDSRLIPTNRKDAVLEKVAELTEVSGRAVGGFVVVAVICCRRAYGPGRRGGG